MATQIAAFAVTTPAGTPASSPQTTQLSFTPHQVDQIDIRIPPGPAGNLGFALFMDGVQVIPQASVEWLVGDNQQIAWPLADYPTTGSWQLVSYNTGAYDHTLYLTFLLTTLPAVSGAGAVVAVIPSDQLAPGGAAAVAGTVPAPGPAGVPVA